LSGALCYPLQGKKVAFLTNDRVLTKFYERFVHRSAPCLPPPCRRHAAAMPCPCPRCPSSVLGPLGLGWGTPFVLWNVSHDFLLAQGKKSEYIDDDGNVIKKLGAQYLDNGVQKQY
jgi:hypothetical protein